MENPSLSEERVTVTQNFWKGLDRGSIYAVEKVLDYSKTPPCLLSRIGAIPEAHDQFRTPINEMATPLHAAFVVSRTWAHSPNHPDFKRLIKYLLDGKAPLTDLVEGKSVLGRASEVDPDMLNYGLFARIVRRTPAELLGHKPEGGKCPLELLIEAKAWQRVRLVIDRGAPLDWVDSAGENALFGVARSMIKQHRDKRYVVLGIMEFLAKKGLSINSRNPKGETVLHAVPRLWNGKDLLKCGLDINAVDNAGTPLLTTALEQEGFELAAELLATPGLDTSLDGPSGPQSNRLCAAILAALPDYPNPEVLLDLGVKLGLDINAEGEDGTPLITQALMDGRVRLVQLLQGQPGLDLVMDGPEGSQFAELSRAFSALPGAVPARDKEAAQSCLSSFQQGVMSLSIRHAPSVRGRM